MQNVDNTLIYEQSVLVTRQTRPLIIILVFIDTALHIPACWGKQHRNMNGWNMHRLSAYSVSFPDSTKANTVKALIKVLSKCNYNPQRREINDFRLLRAPWLERCLPIKVVLTQRPFAQVFDVSLNALPIISALQCAVGKCSRKTMSLLPFAHIRKGARMGLTGRRPLKNKCVPKRHPL